MPIVYEPSEDGGYIVTIPVKFAVGDEVFHVNNDNLIEITHVIGIVMRIVGPSSNKELTVAYNCQTVVDRSQPRSYDSDTLFASMEDAVEYVRAKLVE